MPKREIALFDKLTLPFRFIPDGSPEAQVPPPHGHIRIRAVFRPHPRTHFAPDETGDNWFDQGADDATHGETSRRHPGPAADDLPEAARLYQDPIATYVRASHAFGDLPANPKKATDDPNHTGRSLLPDASPVSPFLEALKASGSQANVVPVSAPEESVAESPKWKACHELCVSLTVGRGYGADAPLLYRRCMRECLGSEGDNY